jgi:hypothetical protein
MARIGPILFDQRIGWRSRTNVRGLMRGRRAPPGLAQSLRLRVDDGDGGESAEYVRLVQYPFRSVLMAAMAAL